MTANQGLHLSDLTLVFNLANGLTNGGVTTWAMNACLRLSRNDARALIVAHQAAEGQNELQASPELEIIRCEVNASEAPLSRRDLRKTSACYRAIPDPIFFPNWSWGTWASVAACLRHPAKQPSRVIGIAHTDEETYYQIMAYYEAIISKFIAVSDAVEARLRQKLPHRSSDIVRLSYPLTTPIGKPRKPEPRQELRIGYAGRIQDYQKRITDIKSLAAKLTTMPGSYQFEVAGDGTHLAELKQFFHNNSFANVNVRFHGLVESSAMQEFWEGVDAAILFSSHEGLSISMIESMAAGCVQIVTDVSGVRDSVQDGVNGYVHRIGDTDAMAMHLSLLLHDPDLLSRMSQASIDHVRKHHDRELLQKEKITCSMSAKGCCWDNAVVESFFSTLKLELNLDDDREILISPQQLHCDLAFWIEGYYNRERRHSTIGYMSPIDYEQEFIAARTLTPVNS